MHENYIEWSYWVGAAKRCKKEIALIQEKLWCQSLNRAVDLSKEQSAGKRNTCNCLAAKTLNVKAENRLKDIQIALKLADWENCFL